MNGLNYPILIGANKVQISHADFDKLSGFGISSFFVSHKMAIHNEESRLKVYLCDSLFWLIRNKKRHNKHKMYYYEQLEFGYTYVEKGDPFYNYLINKKEHFFK